MVLKADEEDKSLPAGRPFRKAALANVAMSRVSSLCQGAVEAISIRKETD